MSLSKKIKQFLFSAKLTKADIVIALLFAAVLFCVWKFRMPLEEVFQTTTAIDYGYEAKQGVDGNYYVVDDGHERLLCFDEDGKIKYEIKDPYDSISDLAYIDDFSVTSDAIYLSVTRWDQMSIAREAILKYDKKGNYVATLVDSDYSDLVSNKHRFYGITATESAAEGDLVSFAKCLADEIVCGDWTIPYENAFNAVSDVTFYEDIMYVLDKDGTIRSFMDGQTTGTIIYSLDNETDADIVPYRLTVDTEGTLYFTDIKNEQVRCVNQVTQNSAVVYSDTSSLTVHVAADGSLLLLDDENGLIVAGEDTTTTYLNLQNNFKTMALRALWFALLIVLILSAVILLIRVIFHLSRKKFTKPQTVSLWVLGTVSIVAVMLCWMLITSFAETYKEKIYEQVKSAAYMVANQINGTDIEQIEQTGGFDGASYRHLCEIMESSFSADVDFYEQIYCNILKLSEDGTEGYAVAYLDQSIGSCFPIDALETEEIRHIYQTGESVQNQEVTDISGSYLSIKVPVYGDDGAVCGVVSVGVETYVITDTIRAVMTKILASIVIMLMLVWLVSIEAMSFATNHEIYRKNLESGEKDVLPGHLIRLLVFLVFMAYNMTATFLPVYLMKKTDILPQSMREMAGAWPITVNLFLIGVMSLFCANLVRKYGIRWIMSISALCSFAGNLCIFLFPHYATICVGLVLDGIGVGLVTNAVYVMITYIKDEVNRTWGLTIYNGACFSGINFGMILGSALAVSVGQHAVFCIVALTWIVMLFLAGHLGQQLEGLLAPPETVSADKKESSQSEQKMKTSGWKHIVNKPVLSFIVLIQNPYIIFGSFVFYYVPIFCDNCGYNETICSILIMLYTEIAVLGGDKLTVYVSDAFRHKAMYIAMGLNIAALILFALTNQMAGLVTALILMGISSAFGKPVQQNYYLELDDVKEYGEDRAIGVYNFTENIGESLGPVVFGRMMTMPSFSLALEVFCGMITGVSALHYALNKKSKIKDKQ